jgi:hypothetical protein
LPPNIIFARGGTPTRIFAPVRWAPPNTQMPDRRLVWGPVYIHRITHYNISSVDIELLRFCALTLAKFRYTVHTRVVETALSEPASGFLKFIAETEPNVAKNP